MPTIKNASRKCFAYLFQWDRLLILQVGKIRVSGGCMGTHFQNRPWVISAFNLIRRRLSQIGLSEAYAYAYEEVDKKLATDGQIVDSRSRADTSARIMVSRKKFSIRRKRIFSYLLVGFTAILSTTAYYSYDTYQTRMINSHTEVIETSKAKLDQALASFGQALSLLGTRLEKQTGNDKQITEILNTDFRTFIEGSFPTVLSLEYRLDNKIYSRLGPESFKNNLEDSFAGNDSREHIIVVEQKIGNSGVLKARLSLESLISGYFKRKEQLSEVAASEGFTLKIGGAGYTYYLDRPQPSLSGFLIDHADFVLLLILSSLVFMALGASSVYIFIRKHNKTMRAQKEEAFQKYRAAYRACSEHEMNIVKLNTSVLNERISFQYREDLFKSVISGFQQMAAEGHKTNSIVTNFLLQESVENHAVGEILKMTMQANQKLKYIASGYLDESNEKLVNLKGALESSLEAFQQKITCKNIDVAIEDRYNKSVSIDSGALHIVIYNILQCILGKFLSHLKIELDGSNELGVSIVFKDDRHVSVTAQETDVGRDILSLSKQQLSELTMIMGWKVSFEMEGERTKTTLWLPVNAMVQGNVVSFKEYRKHA